MNLEVLFARCDFVGAAKSSVRYCAENGIDWSATVPATGGVFLAGVEIEPMHRFSFASHGIEAAVIEAVGADGETVVDLAAWPVAEPQTVLTMFGSAVLGEADAENPATFFADAPLALYRRPLEWLQQGCRGMVVLDLRRAARRLIDVDGRLRAEDAAHAFEIRAAMLAATNVERIVIRRQDVAA